MGKAKESDKECQVVVLVTMTDHFMLNYHS